MTLIVAQFLFKKSIYGLSAFTFSNPYDMRFLGQSGFPNEYLGD
jgi:hypothetical protein